MSNIIYTFFVLILAIIILVIVTCPIWFTIYILIRNAKIKQRKSQQQRVIIQRPKPQETNNIDDLINKYKTNQDNINVQPTQNEQPKPQRATYTKADLLTQYETSLYNKLDDIARQNNLRVITKIRLADLITTYNNNYADFNKISRKHIDFALCSSDNLNPLLLIELDDNTHNYPERRQRDDFVNQSVVQAGYKILHVRNINDTDINNKILSYVNIDTAGVYYI